MVTPLPLSEHQIVQAAQEMIDTHGAEALARALERIKAYDSEGFGSVAKTWELIAEVIRDMAETHPHR